MYDSNYKVIRIGSFLGTELEQREYVERKGSYLMGTEVKFGMLAQMNGLCH